MSALAIGATVMIRRSNGTTQPATISSIDYNEKCISVEWTEDAEVKGKEMEFSSVLECNAGIKISNPARRSAYSAKPKAPSGAPQMGPRRVKSLSERSPKLKEGFTLKKLNKLEKDRIERRKRNAEEKMEREKICKENADNPHWQLTKMITDYRNTIDFNPLSGDENITDHLITVAVRKRPLNNLDIQQKEIDIITVPNRTQLIVHEPKYKVDLTKYLENHKYNFDYTFNENCTNEIVYKYTAQPLIKTVIQGGYATCFAYGQTGSGKTHTMSGNFNGGEKGIYALAATDIFDQIEKSTDVNVSCSFFEIHVKKVADLLNHKAPLKILEDGKQKIQIVGLTEKSVTCANQVLSLIKAGSDERASGQTSSNSNSSRSHAIFQIYLRSKLNPKNLHGKFSLIDLAGNERGADTFSSSKTTRLEGSEINQSLLNLKECIRALGRKGAHLPFRGSKLTQILRDSFVGLNSKTCMIAMVSPGVSSCENTLNTLRYADRVKGLGNNANDENDKCEDYDDSWAVFDSTCYGDAFKSEVDESIISSHREVVRTLKKSLQEAEKLLEGSRYNIDKYSMDWNFMVEDLIQLLLKAKM